MRRQLEEAQTAWLDAKAKLDASLARQQELTATLADVEIQLSEETRVVGQIARNAYMSAGFTSISSVVSTGSAKEFLDGMSMLNIVSTREAEAVRQLIVTRNIAQDAQAAINSEVVAQEGIYAEMEARKQQAQQALWAVGGGQETGGFSASASVIAVPSPRNASGGWSGESCSIYESATGGCITPRTAHARDQAYGAGFTKYVSCYRSLQDGGEHPLGRACDYAVGNSGFGGTAEGEDRSYGNNLAAFFLFNAERLGVLYIIWYRQIWLPSSGWRSYSGCCDPSSMHTNHVHVSMR
jgi:hypothetical protein